MNLNRLTGIFIIVTALMWILMFALSSQPKYQEISIINTVNLDEPANLISNLEKIEPYKLESKKFSIDLETKISSAKKMSEQVDFNLYVYKIGAFASPRTVTSLVKAFNDQGFPAFTQINAFNNELTTVLVGPFSLKTDIIEHQQQFNQIGNINTGEVLSWKP